MPDICYDCPVPATDYCAACGETFCGDCWGDHEGECNGAR